MKPLYVLGVDLGQAQDYTALCILERTQFDTGRRVKRTGRPAEVVYENHYAARHLERLAIGTPYPAQVARIKELYRLLTAQQEGAEPLLIADATGVGRPVIDMLRAAELKVTAATITGGDAVSRDGRDYRIPKRDLVSAVQVLLQAELLKIASSLREAATLTAELLAFKVSISLKGHDSYGNDAGLWRENPHDDLVLAVALACWYGERYKEPMKPLRTRTVYTGTL